jgi:hypothetical protein
MHGSHSALQKFSRRSLIRCAAGASLSAVTPVLNFCAGSAFASNWRGFVGCIKPRANEIV